MSRSLLRTAKGELRTARRWVTRLSPVILFAIFLAWWFWLPDPLFHDPTSTVLTDRDDRLLGAQIASDQQWRFPENFLTPEKFRKAITIYEDRWFFFHPGINPVALIRALKLNIEQGEVVSGGSTISMQVIRLARKNRPRTYPEKLREILLALRLELGYSKEEILGLYASHAPFGGNVVGLEAASWRYFGVKPDHLSWGEVATLAVLPNSPGLIYPGRNPEKLREKRNRLLDLLAFHGEIDKQTCELAKEEMLPGMPLPLPQMASHLLVRASVEGYMGKKIRSTLEYPLQQTVADILSRHALYHKANEIHNAAAVVLSVNSGEVRAYVGNIPGDGTGRHGSAVDIIPANRSTGSLLKPFLYAAMLNDGLLLPTTLVPDVPTQMGGFVPENYNRTYDGAVPAKRALARSLNIPAVKMLQAYGYDQFYRLLRKIGMNSLSKPADHYGLAMILGGAESSLWEMTGIYASMARTLNHYLADSSGYSKLDFHPPKYMNPESSGRETVETDQLSAGSPDAVFPPPLDAASWFDAGTIWLTFEAMVEVARPETDMQWQQFASSNRIAWKTGTSFGNRDAWAIGVTPAYVVGVWVGNATGEGRPGLTGLGMAAPILFEIFDALPASGWFATPGSALDSVAVCHYSGYRVSSLCEPVDTILVPKRGVETGACPFHHLVHLDPSERYQVNSSCYSPAQIINKQWFLLPPVQEYYFSRKNPFYKLLPPWLPGCEPSSKTNPIGMIYPKNNSHIYIPVELDGSPGAAIFRAAYHNPKGILYWHLDETYLGSTTGLNQMELAPAPGWHILTLVSQTGETLEIQFEVMGKGR